MEASISYSNGLHTNMEGDKALMARAKGKSFVKSSMKVGRRNQGNKKVEPPSLSGVKRKILLGEDESGMASNSFVGKKIPKLS